MTSLTASALRGVAWNYAGSAVLVVTQIASTAATARLIEPAGFGAYASAQAAVGIAGYFAFTTISLGILRRSELGPATVGSALALATAAGVAILFVLWFAAAPWAHAWHVASAARLIRLLAVGVLMNAVASVLLALVRRRLRFGAAALVETATQVGGLAASVVLAIVFHSIVALAIGQVVSAAALLLLSAAISRRDISFGFAWAEVRELMTFASQLSFLYFGAYVLNTAPSWMISRSFGASTLGFYSRASLIVGLPLSYLSSGVTKVLFPLYGHVRDDMARTRTLVSEGVALVTGFTWPFFAVVAGGSTVVVQVLLGHRWHAAAPLLQLCVLAACADLPCGLLQNAAEALGWIRLVAARQGIFLLLIGVSLGGVEWGGFSVKGLLLGVALAMWVTYALMLRVFLQRGLLDHSLIARSQLIHGTTAAGAFAAAYGCARGLDRTPELVQVMAQLLVVSGVCFVLLRGRAWLPASRVLGERLVRVGREKDRGLLGRVATVVLR